MMGIIVWANGHLNLETSGECVDVCHSGLRQRYLVHMQCLLTNCGDLVHDLIPFT